MHTFAFEFCIDDVVAVLVGCGPGLYRRAKSMYQTRTGSRPSRGYVEYGNSSSAGHQPQNIALASFQSTNKGRVTSGMKLNNDAASSQEELAHSNLEAGMGDVKVATSSVQEREDSVTNWDDRPHAY
jgi:hypothetical protein